MSVLLTKPITLSQKRVNNYDIQTVQKLRTQSKDEPPWQASRSFNDTFTQKECQLYSRSTQSILPDLWVQGG